MRNMKSAALSLFTGVLLMSLFSCKKNNGYNEIISTDKSKPGVVTNIKVDNYNGGAYITYDLPNSANILYVLAKYSANGTTQRETKSSYYTDTVTVDGFAKAADYKVTLYTVSRANVMSDPVEVQVTPKTPVYQLVRPSVKLAPAFGGVNIKAVNPLKKEIGVIVVALDKNTNTREIQDQFFTKSETIDYTLRGYTSDAREFGVYITDKWGNVSDTLNTTVAPLFEVLLDKSKFNPYNMSSDTPIDFGWVLPNLWNGKTDGDGWHTRYGETAPYVCTFTTGATYRLSRFMLWGRVGDYTYKDGNVKEFALWGSNAASPRDARLPVTAAEGAVVGDWVNMGNYVYPNPPSGLPPGSTNAADEQFVKNGVNFDVPLTAPAVKFLRVAVAKTWSGGNGTYIIEMSFYGQPN